jgi:predicted DNA binding protein
MVPECLVVEFGVTGDDCPLAAATRETGARVDARPPLRRSDGYALVQCSTDDPAVGRRLDADDRISHLHRTRTDGRHTYRCLSKHRCVLHELVDAGFLVESVGYSGGAEHYEGAVVGHEVLEGVLAAAGETVGVSLRRIASLGEDGDESVPQRWDLTPAQVEAVRTAHRMGYFEVPRAVVADEVAEALDISKSAFLERLRRAQGTMAGFVAE